MFDSVGWAIHLDGNPIMSAVFNTVEVSWEGKTYEVKPTMALINKIEQRLPLVRLVRELGQAEPPVSSLVYVIAEILRSVGVQVEEEEVYREIVTSEDPNLGMNLRLAVLAAIFPAPKKKGEAGAGNP